MGRSSERKEIDTHMARPKHSPESRRQHHIGVRFAACEYEKIRAESEKIGVTVSAYIRAKALHGFLHIPKYAKIDTDAVNLFSKMGGLLKKIHTESGGAYSVKTAALLGDMQRVVAGIMRDLERNDRQTHTEPKNS